MSECPTVQIPLSSDAIVIGLQGFSYIIHKQPFLYLEVLFREIYFLEI